MKTLIVALSVVASALASSDTARILHPLEPIDDGSVKCGCTVYMLTDQSARDFYAYSPQILVLDPNGEPPNARVNLGHGNVLLSPAKPIEFPLYDCEAGEVWISEWQSDAVTVRAELNSPNPGEESCGFAGEVQATANGRHELTPVQVACGC
jgi:hypothetical protein